jgi:hypothetical protein
MLVKRIFALISLATPSTVSVALSCGDPPGNDPNVPDFVAPACSIDVPSVCQTAPSYSGDIAPLVSRACLPCHARGGVASNHNLTTYAGLRLSGTTVLLEIKQCLMPPADAGPDAALTLEDRMEILQWFACLTPNN